MALRYEDMKNTFDTGNLVSEAMNACYLMVETPVRLLEEQHVPIPLFFGFTCYVQHVPIPRFFGFTCYVRITCYVRTTTYFFPHYLC